MPTAIREKILASQERLAELLGDWVPACKPNLLRWADQLVEHKVAPEADGVTWKSRDLASIDWTGQSASMRSPRQAHHTFMMLGLLTPLASAFRHTRDERYPDAARRYLEAFFTAYPPDASWSPADHDGATSYPGRIGSTRNPGLLGALPALLPGRAFDDAFLRRVINAVVVWIDYLHRHVYPGRNIRILHGDVLLMSSLRLPFLPQVQAWRHDAVHILNDAVARQLLPDGADMEGSAEYHTDVLQVLAQTARLARAYPDLGLRVPAEKIAAMYDYALHAIRPDGALAPINDTSYSHGGNPFGTQMRRDRERFLREFRLSLDLPAPCRHYPDVGQVFLRDRWSDDATYIVFDATLRRGWHWHPSRNAIQLFAHGRPLIVDPGYPTVGKVAGYGHCTYQHSTMNLNGLSQSPARAWSRLRQVEGYDLVEGLYEGGYWPIHEHRCGAGVHGEHHRAVLWVRDRFMLVLDHLSAAPRVDEELTVESVWQLSCGVVRLEDGGRVAVTDRTDSNLLMLFPLVPPGMSATVHEGELDPPRGWVPEAGYRDYTPAPMVRLHVRCKEMWKAHLATVLIPFAGAARPTVRAEATPPGSKFGDRTAGRVTLDWADGSRDEVIWTGRLEEAIDHQHGLHTDAELVHLGFDAAGALTHGLCAGGDFLRRNAAGPTIPMEAIRRMMH